MLKYQYIAKRICERNAGGDDAAGSMLPPLAEFARLEGCSLSTIQRAVQQLKEEGLVTTRPGLGTFLVRRVAPGSTGGGSERCSKAADPVRVVASASFARMMDYGVFAALFHGLENILAEEGLQRPLQYNRFLLNNRVLSFSAQMLAQKNAGTVCFGFFDDRMLQYFGRHCSPIVSVDRDATGMDIDSVVFDCRAGALIATRELIAAGHRRIAYLGARCREKFRHRRDPAVEERFEGFRLAHVAANLPFDPSLCMDLPLLSAGEKETEIDALLAARDRFTAVVTYGEDLAERLMARLQAEGVRVPQDCTVVAAGACRSDSRLGASYFDHTQTAARMWELLKAAWQRDTGTDGAAERSVVPPQFEPRETVAGPRQGP